MAKILLIDDEEDILEFQKAYLVRRKYEVVTAANTHTAIEAIKNESPDIVFCDLRLKESDTAGLDILEQAKKIKPKLIVYLITGLLEKEVADKAAALGAKGFLIKPLQGQALEDKIKEMIK